MNAEISRFFTRLLLLVLSPSYRQKAISYTHLIKSLASEKEKERNGETEPGKRERERNEATKKISSFILLTIFLKVKI